MTLVDVPVDTVTVYLDPVLSPACFDGSGDLPSGGGSFGTASSIAGELVWPETEEFRRGGWENVPAPASDDEVKVAYVFQLALDPTSRFRLPSGVTAVTPVSKGTAGYTFFLTAAPGNYTLYALAGIENRGHEPLGVHCLFDGDSYAASRCPRIERSTTSSSPSMCRSITSSRST